MDTPRTVDQSEAPCVLHKYHSPVTVQNEYHHPFPQAWQREVWGEVRDHEVQSVCATTHNSIHTAQRIWRRTGSWPSWCVGSTRDMCEEGVRRLEAAMREAGRL